MRGLFAGMNRRSVALAACAKININLQILGRRPDGFHEVRTRMCPVSLSDEVVVKEASGGRSSLSCSDPALPVDESNLALKAVRAFEAATGIRKAWEIHLEKRIPHGAGLGGGSSDAAAVLRGLNELTDAGLGMDQLDSLAASLGSDVAFFLRDGTCDATGRGEKVEAVEFPWRLPLVLFKPPFGVSTPWAYSRLADSKELDGVLYAPQLCEWGAIVNDLERPVFEKWVFLGALKMWLLQQPETLAALMSGSGSTIFAVLRSGAEGAELARRAREFCGETTWVQVARTTG